MVRGLAGKDY